MKELSFDNLLVISVIASISWFLFYLSINNQIHGVDSWYWLKFTPVKPVYFNLVAAWLIGLIFILFFFHDQISWKLLASLYLINLFTLRFLEVELDDFVMYSFTFPVLIFLKKKGINPLLFALPLVIFYAYIHGWFLESDPLDYLEITRTPIVYIYILPSLYLFFVNRRYLELALLLLLSTIFMTPKYVTNALPILVFAGYLNFKDVKFNEKIILVFLLIFMVVIIYTPIYEVYDRLKAFEKFCDKEKKVCYNTNPGSWHYGHYFAWLGYISVNPREFGVCCCHGLYCLNKTLDCGANIPR